MESYIQANIIRIIVGAYSKTGTFRNGLGIFLLFRIRQVPVWTEFCFWREINIDKSYNDMRVIIQVASWERHTNDKRMYANTFEIIKDTRFLKLFYFDFNINFFPSSPIY